MDGSLAYHVSWHIGTSQPGNSRYFKIDLLQCWDNYIEYWTCADFAVFVSHGKSGSSWYSATSIRKLEETAWTYYPLIKRIWVLLYRPIPCWGP